MSVTLSSAAMSADAILAALDPEQRAVAEAPQGPMVVLAGAGTGKTRAITHRMAYAVRSGIHQPSRVLALTFTARAAGEMRTRLRDLGVVGLQARTFHSAALRQLHYFWPGAIGGPAPEVMAHKASAVAEAAGRLRIRVDRTEIRDIAAEIEWAKVGMMSADAYAAGLAAAGREPPAGLDATAMARLLATYEDVKGERGVIDFEDVLLLLVGILEDRDDVARAVRGQYRHFVVDEYQDVSAVQQRLLELWVGERDDLCVVGDPAQTIYSFTGASSDHLLGFTKRWPGSTIVRLTRNYRSTPEIVGLANALLSAPGGVRRSGSVELAAQRSGGTAPVLVAHEDDPAEAHAVAARVSELLDRGLPAESMAVLFRTNGQSELVETALAERDIPYLVRGGERFFQRAEVRDAVLLLRGAVRTDDGEVPLGQLVRDLLLGAGWSHEPPRTGGAARERWESQSALAALADDFVRSTPEARLGDFVRELDERKTSQHAPTVAGVTLASLHATKGLEWDVVFVIGCSEGLLPITMADTPEAIEEERRLLYVGATRARDELVLSWAKARHPGGRASRRPSRFLQPAASLLGPAALGAQAGVVAGGKGGGAKARKSGSGRRRPTCRVCGNDLGTGAERTMGRCTGCPSTYDEALFERLRTWRSETSKAAKVPAFVVLTDATLIAVAERRPTTRGELAAIPGIGAHKLETYGGALLELVSTKS